jgi:hypothetical protein
MGESDIPSSLDAGQFHGSDGLQPVENQKPPRDKSRSVEIMPLLNVGRVELVNAVWESRIQLRMVAHSRHSGCRAPGH